MPVSRVFICPNADQTSSATSDMAANKCFHTNACTKSELTVSQGQSNGAATHSPYVLSTPNEFLSTTARTQNHKFLFAFSGSFFFVFCFFSEHYFSSLSQEHCNVIHWPETEVQ